MSKLLCKIIELQDVLWDQYSKEYDTLKKFYPYQQLISRVSREIGELCKKFPDGSNVLEVGCGTGNILEELITIDNINLIGLDNSIAMLDVARNKFISNKGKITFVQGDAEIDKFNLEEGAFGNNSLDIVFMNLTMFNIENKTGLINTIYNMLSQKGFLLVVDFKPFPKKLVLLSAHLRHRGFILLVKYFFNVLKINRLTKKIFLQSQKSNISMMRKAYNKTCSLISDTNSGKTRDNGYVYLSANELEELLVSAGFEVIKQDKVYEGQANLVIVRK